MTLKIGWEALQLPTQAPKTLFEAEKIAFFGHFWAKNGVFLVMAAPKHSTTCTKTWQNTFFESSTLKIGWEALHPTTQAPQTLF